MRPSDWPWPFKILAVVLFAGIMYGVVTVARMFFTSLSDLPLGLIVGAMFGLGIGLMLGERAGLKASRSRESGDDLGVDGGSDEVPGGPLDLR